MALDLPSPLFGRELERSGRAILLAVGVSTLVLASSFLSLGSSALIEPALVIVGFAMASWSAYHNSGLVISEILMLSPVIARLSYFSWLSANQPSPVALPLSFRGSGAWEMWIPVALVLGLVGFGVGVLLRRSRQFAAGTARQLE
jgi:hypothetical protein